MPTEALYIRIDKALKDRLNSLAQESGLTLRQVSEIVIARGLGMEGSASIRRVNELIERQASGSTHE